MLSSDGPAAPSRPERRRQELATVASCSGLCIAAIAAAEYGPLAAAAPGGLLTGLVAGSCAASVSRALTARARPAFLAAAVVPAVSLMLAAFLGTPLSVAGPSFVIAVVAAEWRSVDVLQRQAAAAAASAFVLLAGSVAPAQAWSVGEARTAGADSRTGNGIVVRRDTHAFLIAQGAAILRADGRTAVADFLFSADPTAPPIRGAVGPSPRPASTEPYLWRVQLGARDADRVLKVDMPDHFFNWWTHSGKQLIGGSSSVQAADEQFTSAVSAWADGQRAEAMYRLGAAAHLVGDACAPPHQFVLDPGHRPYERWMLSNQASFAVGSGGIYADQFRAANGHGGTEWSSNATRGWIDECAHRAAPLMLNAALPLPDRKSRTESPARGTLDHFGDTQRLTAGYLAHFFDVVGAP